MKKIIQNGIILLGFILLAAAGYYLYLQQGDMLLELADEDLTSQLERESQTFIAKQAELRAIDLKLELFSDQRFLELRSFATPVPKLRTGRPNPFSEIDFENLDQNSLQVDDANAPAPDSPQP